MQSFASALKINMSFADVIIKNQLSYIQQSVAVQSIWVYKWLHDSHLSL